MRLCTESTDPNEHVGPFKAIHTFQNIRYPIQIEKCEACGEIAIRILEPELSPRNTLPLAEQTELAQ
jgi:hypothetical protein